MQNAEIQSTPTDIMKNKKKFAQFLGENLGMFLYSLPLGCMIWAALENCIGPGRPLVMWGPMLAWAALYLVLRLGMGASAIAKKKRLKALNAEGDIVAYCCLYRKYEQQRDFYKAFFG